MKRSEKSEGCAILLTEIHVMNGEVNGREKVYKQQGHAFTPKDNIKRASE